jgi:hypothetical protein
MEDMSVPHSARIWNYWLGGKGNFRVDREVGDRVLEAYPAIVDLVRSERDFLKRAVTWLAAAAGIRQFLDIGGGLPAADNTHRVARRVAPDSRVVYVEDDPLVLTHGRELLARDPDSGAAYVEGDLRVPAEFLKAAAKTLDFGRPVAFVLVGVLGRDGNDQEVSYVVRQLMRAAVPGSYLVIAHASAASPGLVTAAEQYAAAGAKMSHLRDARQVERFFDGLELVPPGVVRVSDWDPARTAAPGADGDDDAEAHSCGGVARKPS